MTRERKMRERNKLFFVPYYNIDSNIFQMILINKLALGRYTKPLLLLCLIDVQSDV